MSPEPSHLRSPPQAPLNHSGVCLCDLMFGQVQIQGLSSFSFHVRVAWGSRPPCSTVVAGYACSHPFMVFNRVVSLLDVDLVVVGSLENTWLVGVFRLSCVWIEVHSSSTCCWDSSVWPHPLHIVFGYMFL